MSKQPQHLTAILESMVVCKISNADDREHRELNLRGKFLYLGTRIGKIIIIIII